MSSLGSFNSFMERVRAGDEDAARELVSSYEAIIRREVRLRMHDHRLRRILDSLDISQSVLASFFVRARSGRFALETPEQLVRLLIRMTRIKVAFQVRTQRACRRDNRLTLTTPVEEIEVASPSPQPSQFAADHDLIDAILVRLGDEERQIVGLRAEGWEWSEIAGRLGGSPQARRMQLARAVNRAARALRLDEGRPT